MLSRGLKVNSFTINNYGVCCFGKFHIKFQVFRAEYLEFSLVGTKFNQVLGAEVLGELKEIKEVDDIVAGEDGIVCLTYCRNCYAFTNFHSQGGLLGKDQLISSKDFIEI